MAAQPPSRSAPLNPDTLVIVKVAYDGGNRRFKLPVKDLGAYTFPCRIRQLLSIPYDTGITLERYSDSAGSFVALDSENPSVYKQLYRAAKAKLKLRIKVSRQDQPPAMESGLPSPPPPPPPPPPKVVEPKEKEVNGPASATPPKPEPSNRGSYMQTVLRDPDLYGDHTTNESPKEPEPEPESLPTPPVDPTFTWGTRGSAFDAGNTKNDNINGEDGVICALPTCFEAGKMDVGGYKIKPMHGFSIDCNNCGANIPNVHYHCGICDDGDYDLCPLCVDDGFLCPGNGHWLIKRTLKEGVVTNSTTETIAPKRYDEPPPEPEEPEEPEQEVKDEPLPDMRTCNGCFAELHEEELVTCEECPDYDICLNCLQENTHGHNPAHGFALIRHSASELHKSALLAYCRPGRRQVHAAICDGCDKRIIGVRNKCLNCPDWDYCSDCVKGAGSIHPGHRFAPLYTAIPEALEQPERHLGVYCDGPLCRYTSRLSCIKGSRYKCTICHDTDFCANCEAHPGNSHNPTHPLIKFKSAVRHVSVSTFGEDEKGSALEGMGDRRTTKSTSTETVAPLISNAATQVQNQEAKKAPEPAKEEEKPAKQVERSPAAGLQAYFVKDAIADGTTLQPQTVFTQTWSLYNPGPTTWPIDSSVRFVGGDSMFNVDTEHPSSVGSLISAMESKALTKAVGPLESAKFSVTLKAPRRLGRAISYWRLKTPEGEAFGHKLWCDIQVLEQEVQTVPEPETDEGEVQEISQQEFEEAASKRSATVEPESEEKSESESQMIFPKLDKESPIGGSTHEAESKSNTTSAQNNDEEARDLAEEVESMTFDDDETEDGFLTDEEYDILDASDQEYAVEAQKSTQK